MNLNKVILFVACCAFWIPGSAQQAFTIANTLQSNMVVQQGKPLRLWGEASTGTSIQLTCTWSKTKYATVGNAKNKWSIDIPVPKIIAGDRTAHSISITAGNNLQTLNNILIGEVWLCSGQSNMDMELKPFLPWLLGAMHYRMEIENANYPEIRWFNVRTDFTNTPQEDCGGKWTICSPSTAADLSALAYFFARQVNLKTKFPVGLVISSVGGSSCQAWISRDTLKNDAVLHQKYLYAYDTSVRSKEPLDSVVTFEKVVRPTLFYNAMIHPLKNIGFAGALWYQGESNRFDSSMYTRLCASMIRNWRNLFGDPKLPFYYVQVAPYNWMESDPTLYEYALLREAQANIRNVVPHTEMALTMDISDPNDIHPRNKQDLGYRLAKIALSNLYKQSGIVFKGPEYAGHVVDKDTIRIRFSHIGTGLVTNDGQAPQHFYVAANDGKFYSAQAMIKGDEVHIFSNKVKDPVAVRYAFTNAVVTNLENKEGFPAVPFRSNF